MNATTRRKALIYVGLILIACFAFWCWKRPPGALNLTREKTDATVSQLETVIKSQDSTVERIVTGAKKEVAAKHDEIRKNVSGLSPDAVARELMALLEQYRRERGD